MLVVSKAQSKGKTSPVKSYSQYTCKKGTTTIEGYAFHDSILQVLFYNFREISLQWIFIPEKNPKEQKQIVSMRSELNT